MTAGQFHVEASFAERVASRRITSVVSDDGLDAGIASLLIGVAARGWLCDHEREFLDNLVPSHSLVLLLHGGQYLHPDAVPLLSTEQLESSYLCDNAVYSHRQRMVSGQFSRSRVHAARVGEIDGRPVTFGMIGPEYVDPLDHSVDQFSVLAGRFRAAISRLQPTMDRILDSLRSDKPAIVLNRCSGRIVATNGGTLNWYPHSDRELVDQEFGQAQKCLADFLTSYQMKAENLKVAEIELSVITLTTRQVKSADLAGIVYPRFLASLGRATEALHATASHLGGIIAWQPGHPETELLRLIQEETSELERVVYRYRLLTNYDQLSRVWINPAEALRKTVTNAAIHHANRQLALSEQWSTTTAMEVPAQALSMLYESILDVHFGTGCTSTTTSVSLHVDASGKLKIEFMTATRVPGVHLHLTSDWLEFCTALGRLIGFQVTHRADDASKIETILTHHKG